MSYAQVVQLPQVARNKAATTADILPLHAPRAQLQVFLTGEAPTRHLSTLLASPIGVYVTQTDLVRDGLRVTLDIAPEDFGMTLHQLITTLPEAIIGTVTRPAHMKVQ